MECYEISDDDDSFNVSECSVTALKGPKNEVIALSSDDDSEEAKELNLKDLPEVIVKKQAINALFAPKDTLKEDEKIKNVKKKDIFEENNGKTAEVETKPSPSREMYFAGVKVTLPVSPYPSQKSLLSTMIKGLKKAENCILESPTGSGKTLALLCGALAWQQAEHNRISQENAKQQAESYFAAHPQLQHKDVTDYIATPTKRNDVTVDDLFTKIQFGDRSIYQNPVNEGESSSSPYKRPAPSKSDLDDSTTEGLVSIHKKARHGSVEREGDCTMTLPVTPEKPIPNDKQETPEEVRVPTIYYGARTHAQLQQVIKEFGRTTYAKQVTMSVLSSRDKTCIREFDRSIYASRNDMCRACTKSLKNDEIKKENASSCKFYDNRKALHHGSLPAAFDIEDLVRVGKEKVACPFYAAREMAKTANIIFCPYNYLLDPSIRSSMQINLKDNIVVIDEAHNVENVCRDAASFTFTQASISNTLKELEHVAKYRYTSAPYIDELVITMKSWDDWFRNQKPLIAKQPMNNNEKELCWYVREFDNTLQNHNIGYSKFKEFAENSSLVCRRLRDDPRTLQGVTQESGALLEGLAIVLGYFYREEKQRMDDYAPILKEADDKLSVRLLCLHPGVAMSSVVRARSTVLASGTLAPRGALHAELDAPFPHCAAPPHVVPHRRVWVGVESSRQYAAGDRRSRAEAGTSLGALLLHVCRVTPHGVLCFLSSYSYIYDFINTWKQSGVWKQLHDLKHVFVEQRGAAQHEETMKDYYECVESKKGALLLAVYRGKVSEGMDFRDRQARAVVCVGIPFPNPTDPAVRAKKEYNRKYEKSRGLLSDNEWMKQQAFRALNQAVGRCVRHRHDWGGVVLADSRLLQEQYGQHLARWLRDILDDTRQRREDLADFMTRMTNEEEEEILTP
ncbi:Fanconi anemia group J protein homolog isoform X2 [Anticarsia gemmatalis]|uniref:Fanconi anemia group J protein homolog isoform X2 n=1 Tax=Anticarsia gemmatalis TaxID=129554 RepID=UPI003F760E9C